MNPLPLTLVRDADVDGSAAAAAWFIPGADPATWLAEVATWAVPFDEARLCLLPRSAADRRPCGALAILTAGTSPRTAPSPLAQPYACLVGRLYLPASTRLHPPVSDDELAAALLYPLTVFHPSLGPVGFAAEDLIVAADLVALAPPLDVAWDRADPGLPPPPPLRAVFPSVTPTVQSIRDDARGDIGSNAAEDLPPLPEESTVRGLASKSAIGMLGALAWLAGHLPGGRAGDRARSDPNDADRAGSQGQGEGWRQRVERWSADKIAALRQSLARARHKELARLLKLCDDDIDEALRYALPLTATAGRGIARPGARLTARDVDFNASSLGRASAADPWDASQFQQQLAVKYRQAANRELGLGRYRRAAYIFAQLLGDHAAAANALRQGRFFREAATLYRDRLKDPAAAAECLEAGGLLLEAIPLYEQLGRHEKVGDLYATLRRPDEARANYRRAASQLVAAGDLVAAARLLDAKLDAPDEALATLESGWPQSHGAAACMHEAFALMGRRNLHEQANLRLARFRPEFTDGGLALSLTDVFARVAVQYPDAELRARAADATRVVAGHRVASAAAGPSELRTLLNAVMRVAADDRLLARDANRYVARAERPAAKPPAVLPGRKPPPAKVKEPALVCAFHLGGGTRVKSVLPTGDVFYAIGVRDDLLVFVRGRWDGDVRSTQRRDPHAADTHYRVERASARSNEFYAVPLRRAGAPPPTDFGPDAAFPPSYLHEPPDARAGVIFDLCRDERDVLWSLRSTDDAPGLAVYTHDAAGRLLSSTALDVPPDPDECPAPVAIAARGGEAWVLCGDQIYCVTRPGPRTISLHRPATNMIVSNPHVRTRLVLTFDEGGVVVWPEDGHTVRFAEGLLDPVACFTRGGALVVGGGGRGMSLRVDRSGATRVAPFEHSPLPPIALVPTADPDGFAAFFPDGLVRVMKLPPA